MGTIASINGVDEGEADSLSANVASISGASPTVILDTSGDASHTPTVTNAGGTFGIVTATIIRTARTPYTNPNYSAVCTLADGTVTVTDANIDRVLESDSSHLAGTLVIADVNTSTAERTLTVRAQEFGTETQSAVDTAVYTPVFPQNSFIRVQACDSSGNSTASNMSIRNLRFYTGTGQTGTELPPDLTANDSATDLVVRAGHTFSATYAAFKAFDNTETTMSWALSGSAANNYIQIGFSGSTYSTLPIFKSMKIKFQGLHFPTHFKLTGFDNDDGTGNLVDYGVFSAGSGIDSEKLYG